MEVVKAAPFSSEYWAFWRIAVKAFPAHFLFFHVILASAMKKADAMVIKLNGRVVGGFILSDLPLNLLRLPNIFSRRKKAAFGKLIADGHRYLTYAVIDKKYRNNGFGLLMFTEAKKKYDMKSYLTPFTPGLRYFYEKCGAKIYKTERGETLEGLGSPVMIFER